MSYPYIYAETIKVVPHLYIGLEQILACVGTIIFCKAWNMYSDRLFKDLARNPTGFRRWVVDDYLTWETDERFDFIITNPPYSLASEFVEKSMKLLDDNGMCCMFLKLQFLEGAKRKELFRKYPPKYIYVFRNRMATWKNGFEKNPDTGKKWAETICFAWFVWVKGSATEPVIRWIN